MADTKKPSIGNSVSYKIGGREYSAKDVSHLNPSLTGNAKTGTDISQQSENNVQKQTGEYHKADSGIIQSGIQREVSSTPKTVESIKTGAGGQQSQTPYIAQPSQTPPSSQRPLKEAGVAPSVSRPGTEGIKTQTTISAEAEQKVKNQTDAGIQSETQRTPRTIEAIKTGTSPISAQDGNSYKPQTMGGSVSPSVGSVPYVATGNVRTQSSISGEAVQKVQNQTDTYRKTGAYERPEAAIHDRINKSPVNIAGVQTGGAHVPHGTHTSFFDAVTNTRDKPINLATAANMVAGKAQSALSGQEDFGTQAAGTGISAGLVGVQTFKATQAATESMPMIAKTAIGGLYNAGKGVYQVGLTGGLAVVAVNRTAAFVKAGQFQAISHASMQMLKTQALALGLNRTALAQGIIHSVGGIQTKLQTGIQTVNLVGNQIRTGYRVVQNGIKIVQGVTNGTISVNIAAKTISKFANKTVNIGITGIKTGMATGIKTGKWLIVKGTTKGVPFIAFKGIPKTARFLHSGAVSLAGIMQNSEDWTINGAGNIAMSADIGLRTAVKGMKATGYAVHTAVKGGVATGKTALAAGKFIKNNGLRAAWKTGRRKAAQTAVRAGKSIITALINAIKALGSKIIVPLLILVVVVMAFNGVIMVPVTAISSIFSSMFTASDTNTDYDVREYLNTIVPGLSSDFQQNLADQMTQSWSRYNIVRFYSNTGSADVVEPTLAGITSIFPTNDELLNMMQPVFNAVVLMNYDLEPTEAEARALTEEIFSRLFTVTTANSTEYCGQSLLTGEGTPLSAHSCGSIHALSDCPNKVTGTHSSYTCDDCCYYDCPGHDDGDGGTDYCGGCVHKCSGYTYCGSHSVISYTLSVDGIYRLEAEYFLTPIEQLSNIPHRTEEEESKLQELKDYHEIFQEMMSQVSINYGGGMTMADLSGVTFINGTRTENQAVIDLALSQVGQAGGRPYWSYYGFSSRVEWCACFVHWSMRNTPSASGSYPNTANNAYCQTVANNFMSIGQWGDRGFTDLVAGDTIFFDWQGDGHTDHIGLVIGTDGTNVYTVEGNSGDAVKLKSYPIGSSVIYGYGLMNY